MGIRALLGILIVHAWMDGVLTVQVPSKFLGLWEGSAVSSTNSWEVTAGIIGGSFNSTVALVQFLTSNNVCVHRVRLTTGEDEEHAKSKKTLQENEELFEGKSDIISNFSRFRPCNLGEFKFQLSRLDRTLVDLVWRDPTSGEVVDEFSFALKRLDDAQSVKTIDTCTSKAASSPLAKLRSRLSCQDTKGKRKKGGG